MIKTVNSGTIEGLLFKHDLKMRTVSKQGENFGQQFINGKISIALNEDATDAVDIHYSYVTPQYKSGKTNGTFTVLKNIIDSNLSVENVGKDRAMKLKLQPSVSVNDWYTTENGKEVLKTTKRLSDGFINEVNTFSNDNVRNKGMFVTDFLITRVVRIEAAEDGSIPEHVSVDGYAFDFRGNLVPMNDLWVVLEDGMDYFEGLDVSPTNLVFTQIWGEVHNLTNNQARTTESGFGQALVTPNQRSYTRWFITGIKPDAYTFGEDEECSLTVAEMSKKSADRQVYLADVKRRQDEYEASKKAAPIPAQSGFGNALNAAAAPSSPASVTANATPAPATGFNFLNM